MKLLKKIAAAALAVVVTGTVAFSVDSTVAKANVQMAMDSEITVAWVSVSETDVKVDCKAAGVTITDVYGVRFTFGDVDLSGGAGGATIISAPSTGWWGNTVEYGNEGADKPVTMVAVDGTSDYTITRLDENALFADTDTDGAIIVLQQYWGATLNVTKVEILGKDGSVLKAAPAPYAAGDTINLYEVTLENLADNIQSKEMYLNGEKISDYTVGLKPADDNSSKVSFKINVNKAGKYDLTVVYNAKGDNRPMAVKVNDGAATDVELPSTSSEDYTTCGTKTITVTLVAGENTITFSQASTYDNSTVKTPNLVTATVTYQAGQDQPATGVSSVYVIVAAMAVLVFAAAAVVTGRKRA